MVTSCRPISDVSSDLTIEVGAANFALHKVRDNVLDNFLSNSISYFCVEIVASVHN